LLYFTENALKESELYKVFFLGGNFVSSLICTLKSKKPLKTLKIQKKNKKPKNCFYKPRFFSNPECICIWTEV